MKNNILLFIIYFFCIHFYGQTQENTVAPKYSNEFMQIGVGAEALGIGNALVAGVDDVTSVYWNPAGLTQVKKRFDVGLMHSEYFAGIAKYDYVGMSYRIDEKSVVGFAGLRFGVDNIPNTIDLIDNYGALNYDNISYFSAANYGFLISYARQLAIKGLSIGGTAKIIYRKAGDFAQSWGIGIDAGLQYRIDNKWLFGIMARDVTTTFNAWIYNINSQMKEVFIETGNEIPENGLELTLPRIIIGARRNIAIGWQDLTVSPEINIVITTDGMRNTLIRSDIFSMEPLAGLEIGWKDIVAVRAGVNNFQYETAFDESKTLIVQPNIGVGVTIKGITLDYSFTNISGSKENMYSHVISLRFGFK